MFGFFKNNKTISLQSKNPIYKIENDCVINVYGDITVAYQLTPPEIYTLTEEEYDELHNVWEKAINVLPENTVVHKQDWYMKEKYQVRYDNNTDEPSVLTRCFFRHFHERPYLHHECYLYLSKTTENNMKKTSKMTTLVRPALIAQEHISEISMKEFFEKVKQFQTIIANSKYKIKRLTTDDLCSNSTRQGLISRYMTLSSSQQIKKIAQDYSFDGEVNKIGDKRIHVFSLSDIDSLPADIYNVATFEPLCTDRSQVLISQASTVGINLYNNHIYNQYIFIENQQKIINNLERNLNRLTSLARVSRENTVNATLVNGFLNAVHVSGAKVLRAHANVIAWSDNIEEDENVKNDTGAAFVAMNCTPRHNTTTAPVMFWSAMPGNSADFPADEKFITTLPTALCLFTHETNYHSSLSPFGIKLTDRITGKPLHVDISIEPYKNGIITNFNKFIIGPSGSGKSFFTNHLVRQYYEQGTHIVLVDVGHSYVGMCQMINQQTHGRDGIYYDYKDDNPISFNPFYTDDNVFDIEKVESIKTLIIALFKKSDEPVSNVESTIINNTLSSFISVMTAVAKGEDIPYNITHAGLTTDGFAIEPSFNAYFDFLFYKKNATDNNELDNLQKLICNFAGKPRTTEGYLNAYNDLSFSYGDFRVTLTPFYRKGKYDYLLNAEKNIDLLNKRFVVFELDNIQDNPVIFPVVTIIIMEMFINKMRRLGATRKMIVIEEAWKAIAKEGMAEYIKYLFKTVRKFNGEAVVVTQELDDIMSSDIVKDTVINNSDCKILLDQSKYMNRFDEVQKLLGLNDKQVAQVMSINKNINQYRSKYKEVWIGLGSDISNVYAVEVSKAEYYAYTSDKTEKVQLLEKAKKLGSMVAAILDLSNET